jgi:hypothetical protein
MKKFLLVLFLFAISSQAFAQDKGVALKFDEFDDQVPGAYWAQKPPISMTDRLNRFIKHLKTEPNKSVYIIYYLERKRKPYLDSWLRNWAEMFQYRIHYDTKISRENVFLIYGGLREHNGFEYWIAPKGAEPPKPTPAFSESEGIICPFLSISYDRANFTTDRTISFTAYPLLLPQKSISWRVSAGEIVTGQNTNAIVVSLKNTLARSVTAFAETSEFPYSCENVFMARVDVSKGFYLFDNMENYNYSQLLARLDNFFVGLQAQPQSKGYLIVYGGRDNIPTPMFGTKRIQNHIAFRRFPLNRITVINGGYREVFTVEMWILPPNSELPVSTPTVSEKFIIRKARPKK